MIEPTYEVGCSAVFRMRSTSKHRQSKFWRAFVGLGSWCERRRLEWFKVQTEAADQIKRAEFH
jgi:hypothetical protein